MLSLSGRAESVSGNSAVFGPPVGWRLCQVAVPSSALKPGVSEEVAWVETAKLGARRRLLTQRDSEHIPDG